MQSLDEYCSRLGAVLHDRLGLPRYPPPRPAPVGEFTITAPDYAECLARAYGLNKRALHDSVFRIGYGNKLTREDSQLVVESAQSTDRPVVHEKGIICRTGILAFYHDVFSPRRRNTQLLAVSYHFQTAPQAVGGPLYVRFEFDPASPRGSYGGYRAKPIFHYHFADFQAFHDACHFPGGHFEVPDGCRLIDPCVLEQFRPPKLPDLDRFLESLTGAGLI